MNPAKSGVFYFQLFSIVISSDSEIGFANTDTKINKNASVNLPRTAVSASQGDFSVARTSLHRNDGVGFEIKKQDSRRDEMTMGITLLIFNNQNNSSWQYQKTLF